MKNASWKKPALLVALLVALGAAGYFLPLRDWLGQLLETLRAWGIWGLVALAGVYALAVVVFAPGLILTLGAGFVASAIWGARPWLALLAGVCTASAASVTGASLAFLVGRTLARDWVARRVQHRPRFEALDEAVARNGLKTVFLLRLSPILPFNLLNYALGLTGVRLREYVLASWAGMLPATVLYVYLGTIAGDLASLFSGEREGGPWRTGLLIAGLAATVAVVALITWEARKALREEVGRPGDKENGDAKDAPAQ